MTWGDRVLIDDKVFVLPPPRERDAPGHRSIPCSAAEAELAPCMHDGQHEIDVVGWGRYGCAIDCKWRRDRWGRQAA